MGFSSLMVDWDGLGIWRVDEGQRRDKASGGFVAEREGRRERKGLKISKTLPLCKVPLNLF